MEKFELKQKNLTEQLFCEAVIQFLKSKDKKRIVLTEMLQEK